MTLCDAGPLYALVDRGDPSHAVCMRVLGEIPMPLATTDAALTEAMHFAGKHLGWPGQAALWRMVRDGKVTVLPVPDEMRDYMAEEMERYRDLPMDYADASLLAIAESLADPVVFTLDSDFRVYRLRNRRQLRVVP